MQRHTPIKKTSVRISVGVNEKATVATSRNLLTLSCCVTTVLHAVSPTLPWLTNTRSSWCFVNYLLLFTLAGAVICVHSTYFFFRICHLTRYTIHCGKGVWNYYCEEEYYFLIYNAKFIYYISTMHLGYIYRFEDD